MNKNSLTMGTENPLNRVWRAAISLLTFFFLLQFISLYLGWQKQLFLGAVSIAFVLVLDRCSKSKFITLGLMLFSLAAMRGGGCIWSCNSSATNQTAA